MGYEFEEAKNGEKTAKGAIATLLISGVGLLLKGMSDSKKEQDKSRINQEIIMRQNRVNELEKGFFGKTRNAKEINELNNEIGRLEQEKEKKKYK